MAQYKTGQETRQNVLDICKKLFYNQGYRETAFGEICEKAGVNPGSISYHFKGKTKIAQTIYSEVMYAYQHRLKELFPELDDLDFMILCLCVHLKFLYEDAGYRRFVIQVGADCMEEFQKDQFKSYSPVTYQFLNSYLDPGKRDFVIAASAGYDGPVSAYISRSLDTLPFRQAVHYVCELYLYFMNYQELAPHIDKVLELAGQLSASCKDFHICLSRMPEMP